MRRGSFQSLLLSAGRGMVGRPANLKPVPAMVVAIPEIACRYCHAALAERHIC